MITSSSNSQTQTSPARRTSDMRHPLSVIKLNEMEKNREKEISKNLSYVLRHRPDSIGIQLDSQGWTNITLLIEKLKISQADLEFVVKNNSKNRFSISDDEKQIRANQGHSVKIELGLSNKTPPTKLYHGTTNRSYELIKKEGLKKMNRNHVHLSSDIETAKQVGSRHGKPIILVIDCKNMIQERIKFYQSENGVWLTEFVSPKYITEL